MNDHKLYNINNFVIHILDSSQAIVMHNKGIVKLYDEKMISCVEDWDRNQATSTDYSHLLNIFHEQCDNAIGFLLENAILFDKKDINYDIKNTYIFSNDSSFIELARFSFFKDLKTQNNIIEYYNESNTINFDNNSFITVFLNPYNKILAKKIRDAVIKSKNSILLMSYVYNNNFYVDSIYFPELYVPCHMCHIGHIESQLRVNTENQISYQQIIDSIYYEQPSFSIHTPLTQNNLLTISSILSNKIYRHLFEHDDVIISNEEFQECTLLDLQTGKLFTDYSIHWELCDCYE